MLMTVLVEEKRKPVKATFGSVVNFTSGEND